MLGSTLFSFKKIPKAALLGEVPALPCCYSQGQTIDELKDNIREAIAGARLLSDAFSTQDKHMAKIKRKPTTGKNGSAGEEKVSELGRILQKLRDKHVASGAKLLNRRELEREIAERRGLR